LKSLIKNIYNKEKNAPMKKTLIAILTFLVAGCSIIYELAFAHVLSIIYGNTIQTYAITIGIFLFSMGIGALAVTKIKNNNEKITFFYVEVLISITALLFTLLSFHIASIELLGNKTINYSFIAAIGILSGAELPLLGILYNKSAKGMVQVLSIDYFGSLSGTLIFAFVLLGNIGPLDSILYTSITNLFIAFLFALVYHRKAVGLFLLTGLIGINIYAIYDDKLFKHIEKQYYNNTTLKWYEKWVDNIPDSHFIEAHNKIKEIHHTKYQTYYITQGKIKTSKGTTEARCLWIGKGMQYCDQTVHSYHEFLCKTPQKILGKPKNALIIGGGDLICAKYLLEDKNIEEVILIDLDKDFVKWANKNIHYNEAVLKDKRLKVIYGDAYSEVLKLNKKFDLIIEDLPILETDALIHIYTVEFYRTLKNLLKTEGLYSGYVDKLKNDSALKNILTCAGWDNGVWYPGINLNKFSNMAMFEEFILLGNIKKIKEKSEYYTVNYIQDTAKEIKGECNESEQTNSIFKPNYNLILKPNFKND